MSVAFSSVRPRSKGEVTQQTIQKMLDENHHLIQCIMDYQSKGKTSECTQYQQILHRNLVYLATIADSNQNMQSLLPAPPTINIGSGGLSQGSGHGQSNLNDSMGPGINPASMVQNQMSNGPNHSPMQHQLAIDSNSSYGNSASGYNASQGMIQSSGPGYGSSSSSAISSSPSSSRSNINRQSSQVSTMHQQSTGQHYSSTQAAGQHFQGQQGLGVMGHAGQGNIIVCQRSMGSYRSSQQGSSQQYLAPDEFYGEQYGHTQSSSEPINQQYYHDGHGEYSYQQPSYGDQGFDRTFDDSQNYYEGGNPQYSQQQSFSQQQYPSQQGYSGQPQGYGSGQGGSSQYSQYQQGQSQQYGSYRSSQGGPGAQSQRSYSYDQGQYGSYPQ